MTLNQQHWQHARPKKILFCQQLHVPRALILEATQKHEHYWMSMWGQSRFHRHIHCPALPSWYQEPDIFITSVHNHVNSAPVPLLMNSLLLSGTASPPPNPLPPAPHYLLLLLAHPLLCSKNTHATGDLAGPQGGGGGPPSLPSSLSSHF